MYDGADVPRHIYVWMYIRCYVKKVGQIHMKRINIIEKLDRLN